jgi:hypothetical protein
MNPDATLPLGRFSGKQAFEQLVRDAFALAAREGWPQLMLSDASFEDWPLRERVVVESLNAWAKTGRQMVIVASRFDAVQRHHARFVSWRQTWGHIVTARVNRMTPPTDFPSAIWSPTWVMHRLDSLHSVGVSSQDPERRTQLKETLDELVRHSAPGFASSTLGL